MAFSRKGHTRDFELAAERRTTRERRRANVGQKLQFEMWGAERGEQASGESGTTGHARFLRSHILHGLPIRTTVQPQRKPRAFSNTEAVPE